MDLNTVPEPLELDREGCLRLADSLPDTPMNAASIGFLREGKSRAWVAGPIAGFRAAVLQWDDLPEDLVGFGTDAEALCALLKPAKGWTCIDVEGAVAASLGNLVTERLGLKTHLHEGVYYQLLNPVKVIRHPAVRILTPADSGLVDKAALAEFKRNGFDPKFTSGAGVGVHAGAVVDGRVVSFVGGDRVTPRYGDMGACTLEAHRGHGYAISAASIVAGYLQERGLIPTWSTGVGNPASMKVVENLGFVEVLPRRCYVVIER